MHWNGFSSVCCGCESCYRRPGDKALNTYANRPRMYYRYVDDTIAAIKKTNIDDFHQHLNSLNTHIQFTIERYKDTGIPFLDTFC